MTVGRCTTRARALALALGVGLGLAFAGRVVAQPASVTVRAAPSKALGTTIIVDAGGFTLYHLTSERKGSIGCLGSCAKAWPPLVVAGAAKPVAGLGLSASRLGTLRRPDGRTQVTYDGYALYLYSGDTRAGEVNGQGVGRLWYALTPSGAVTRASDTPAPKSASASAGAPPASSQSSTSPVTTTSSAVTVSTSSCPPGLAIPQGGDVGNGDSSSNDGDDDNQGGADDGDGCL